MTSASEEARGPLPASPNELHRRLASLGIATTTRQHAPVFTVEEARRLRGEIPGAHCKNLFLIDKNGQAWLVVCLEDTSVDLKALPAAIGSGRLSFAKPELLRRSLGVDPGSVTPFALINAPPDSLNVVLDESMMREEILNYHPLHNAATTSISSSDLLKFIRACGHQPKILALPSRPPPVAF
ncbi:MAG TPA: prolyl-tRNA synthetase associated domain-containing protein [Aestuariivirgaceae bacterium]|jgi:Ala-tRNA(Pro) deacylase